MRRLLSGLLLQFSYRRKSRHNNRLKIYILLQFWSKTAAIGHRRLYSANLLLRLWATNAAISNRLFLGTNFRVKKLHTWENKEEKRNKTIRHTRSGKCNQHQNHYIIFIPKLKQRLWHNSIIKKNINKKIESLNIRSKLKIKKEKLTKISQPLAGIPQISQPFENPDVIQHLHHFCQI